MPKVHDLDQLAACLRDFADQRDWRPFHTPKNLSMALIVEAAELVEHFQWRTPEESLTLPENTRNEVAEEMADILIYLTRMADVLNIDLIDAAGKKIDKNAIKYPPLRD